MARKHKHDEVIVADQVQTEPAPPPAPGTPEQPVATSAVKADSHTTMVRRAAEDKVMLIHQGGAFGEEGKWAVYTPQEASYVGWQLIHHAFEVLCAKLTRGADDGR